MAVPADWKQFVNDYRADRRFQYFPHGHVSNEHFPEMLSVLSTFQGKEWSDQQVMKALRAAKLSKGHSAAGVRMLRAAAENLGFCWFEDHRLTMTDAGFAFIKGIDRDELLHRQLWRYKLPNPVNDGANGFDLFPHRTLLRILCSVEGGKVTRDEFILFVGRCQDDGDVASVIEQINEWRQLRGTQRDAVISALPQSVFERHTTDTSYALGFHGLASYLERFNDERNRKGIRIKDGERKSLLQRLKLDATIATPAAATRSEFVAHLGNTDDAVDPLANLDHLLDTSQWTAAIEAFKKLPTDLRRGRTPKQFEQEVFLERDLEKYLSENIQRIEPGLTLVSPQYPIEAGIIDLLAESKSGELVVIELKKVRASDKVFGQLCRYIGCLMERPEAEGKRVRGYIIGSEIDFKLRYAAKVAPKDVVRLKRFIRNTDSPEIFVED